MSNISRLEAFYSTVWIDGNAETVDDFFAPDARIAGLTPDMTLSPADFVTCVQAMLALVTEPVIRVVRVIEEGEWLAALVRCKCLLSTSGKPIEFDCQVMLRFRDGRIVEAFNTMDTANFMVQLGVLPPDAIERLMTGRAI